MVSLELRCLTVAALLAAAAGLSAQAPGDSKAASPAKPMPPAETAPTLADLEALKLPADAILVIVEQAADAFKMVPRAIVLKADKYQELLDELARLRAQLRADKPAPPSKCFLKGKVEGNLLTMQAQFDFVTERPQVVIRLGCLQAEATEVVLDDGRKPLLRRDADGFAVLIEKPGEHKLTLDLALALTARGGGRGVELDLPRAAITRLELELPAGSKDLRRAGKPLADPLLEFKGNQLIGSLPGPADRLDLAWSSPSAVAGAGVLTAQGRVLVRVEERQTAYEVELLLQLQGGQSNAWKVLVPPGADVKLPPGEEGRLAGIDADEKTYGRVAVVRTIRLKEPAAALKVLIALRGPLPRPGAPVAVGPFAALGATRQEGTLLIGSAMPGLRLDFQRRGEVAPRELRREEQQNDPALVAAFHYWGVPLSDKPSAATGPGSLSLLDVEAEPVRGLIEARVGHTLQVVRDGSGARRWRIKTRVEATPVRTGVDQVRVQLPPGFRYAADVGPPDPAVRAADLDEKTNVLTFRLNGAAPKAFALNLEGDYPEAVVEAGKATLALPRPLDTRDLGGQVAVGAPDDLELLPAEAGNATLELTASDPQTQTWKSARIPERIDVAWQPYRPELPATAEVDLTLTPREGQVRHTLRFRFRRAPPEQLALRIQPAIAGRLKVHKGGNLVARQLLDPEVRLVDLRSTSAAGDPAGRETTLVLEYSFPLPDEAARGAPIVVPLVQPDVAARGETRVRVWGEPGALPLPPGGAWTELNLVKAADNDRLPALVLRAQSLDAPLALRLGSDTTAAVQAERALVRAAITEGGGQSYRVSFVLGRLTARHLDIELPAPVASLDLRIVLDGKKVDWEAVDEAGQRADGGRVARLRLGPDLVKRGSILEVAYDLPPGRGGTGLVRTTLAPPTLCGEAEGVPTRWLVQLPANSVALGPEGGPGQERAWTRRGWLFAPRPAVGVADLEGWFAGPQSPAAPLVKGDADEATPSLTCWRDSTGPLQLTHAPRQGWLLVCSLGVLGLGLSLYFLARGGDGGFAAWLLPVLALLATGLAIASLFWPTALAAVAYGSQPGAAVLLAAGLVLWAQHEGRRRRAAFLPNFSRSRTGSTSARGSVPRGPGEPSTVDVPRPNGSAPRSSGELPRLEVSGSSKTRRESPNVSGPGA